MKQLKDVQPQQQKQHGYQANKQDMGQSYIQQLKQLNQGVVRRVKNPYLRLFFTIIIESSFKKN